MRHILLFRPFFVVFFYLAIVMPFFSSLNIQSGVFIVEAQINKQEITLTNPISLLFENKYHNLSEVYMELENFNNSAPQLIDYGNIGSSYYNKSIPLITLTNEQIPSYSKGKTYIVAHHHAREHCTIEHVLRLIRDLVNGFGTDPQISELFNKYIIYIIVTLNPDSLDIVIYDNEWIRKTAKPIDDDGDGLIDEDGPDDLNEDDRITEYAVRRYDEDFWTYFTEGIDNDGDGKVNEDWIGGVDLNRNYPFHWNDSNADSGATSDKSSFTYPGENPASEKETQALMDFASKHNFTHALSLHSGTNTSVFD